MTTRNLICLMVGAALLMPVIACSKEDSSARAKTDGAVKVASSERGEAVYEKNCSACHKSGIAGAPKIGDTAAWSDRIAKGKDSLYDNSINGYKGMPAKGGNASLSDEDVKAAVDYMVEESQ